MCEPSSHTLCEAPSALCAQNSNCKLQTANFHSENSCLISFNKRVKIILENFDELPRKAALLDFSSLSKSK